MKLQKRKHLQKQLKRWIKKSGLKLRWKHKNLYHDIICLECNNFYWCIAHDTSIYRSCRKENFDRWANSTDYHIDYGETQKEFVDHVNYMKSLKEVNG
jgi:hypothetical protein